jgi:hypothetical protein
VEPARLTMASHQYLPECTQAKMIPTYPITPPASAYTKTEGRTRTAIRTESPRFPPWHKLPSRTIGVQVNEYCNLFVDEIPEGCKRVHLGTSKQTNESRDCDKHREYESNCVELIIEHDCCKACNECKAPEQHLMYSIDLRAHMSIVRVRLPLENVDEFVACCHLFLVRHYGSAYDLDTAV